MKCPDNAKNLRYAITLLCNCKFLNSILQHCNYIKFCLKVEKGRANAALEQITATMRGATTQRGEMTSLKANTERESAELARRKVISFFSVIHRY